MSAVALVRIFMFDAGMKSLPALREYSVSPRVWIDDQNSR